MKIKDKPDHTLICDYVRQQVILTVKANNTRYSTKKMREGLAKAEQELLKRGLLTEDDIELINK